MVFTDPLFLFGFLPLTLLAFHGARWLAGGRAALGTAVFASLVFYGWWNPPYLLLLGGSLAFNYLMAVRLADRPGGGKLALAVGGNLALLGYFKYRGFFLENVGWLTGHDWSLGHVFVPLAISFYTFEQIALLVDIADGKAKRPRLLDFTLYVVLFPHLIAGPIVLFRELDHQFAKLREGGFAGLEYFGPGLVVFLAGLFKKVALADNLAPYVDTAFQTSQTLSMLEAWAAALGYGLQLYFDFSGYSDMAVGLGLMLGFVLPINFDTPYRAVSMLDFWKRWHMTMTRFFMLYVYSPLALAWGRMAMERGYGRWKTFSVAVMAPTLATFLLSGLWHGAGWTYVMFGLVNAIGLVANHAWRQAKLPRPHFLLGWAMTMAVVAVSFVYFRSQSLEQAHTILAAMVSPSAFILPNWLSGVADSLGIAWTTLPLFSSGTFTAKMGAWMAVLGVLSVAMPNWSKSWSKLQPRWRLALVTAGMVWLIGTWLGEPRSFIYFQF